MITVHCVMVLVPFTLNKQSLGSVSKAKNDKSFVNTINLSCNIYTDEISGVFFQLAPKGLALIKHANTSEPKYQLLYMITFCKAYVR